MLKGPFKEASQNEVSLGDDDDPEALLTVLWVAHFKGHEIAQRINLAQLFNIATICDKYDTVATCRMVVGERV